MTSSSPQAARSMLAAVLLVASLAALASGFYGLSGASGLPTAWLGIGPFASHATPSLVLFVVVGGVLLAAGISVLLRWRSARTIALAGSAVVFGWAVLQYVSFGRLSWVQPVFAMVGASVLCLALLLPRADDASAWR